MQLPAVPAHAPYDGPRRKLVIAFDIGTTLSGASFAKLEPGAVPSILGVTSVYKSFVNCANTDFFQVSGSVEGWREFQDSEYRLLSS